MDRADWETLADLRAGFLACSEETRPEELADYWADARTLELYDAFFAARIGWKWDAALAEVQGRALIDEAIRTVLDWGCGTGIATRRFARARRSGPPLRVRLHDRSARAVAFAKERCALEGIEVEPWEPDELAEPDLLLVSHVLSELDASGARELLRMVRQSRYVLWVESGNRATARRLAAIRDDLLPTFRPLAPCPHASACGTIAPGAEQQWCHHFAPPPASVFQDATWAEAARVLGLDLRALPYTYLLLERAPSAAEDAPSAPGPARLLGRPRAQRGLVRAHFCRREGVQELELLERTDRRQARALARGRTGPYFELELSGGRIARLEERS